MKSLLNSVELTARAIVWFARQVVICSGIALMVFMTANVIARYLLTGGGFSFAQELPVLIFPWFILAGIVLAAHSGGHMAVEWIYDKLKGGERSIAFVVANLLSAGAFVVLGYQAYLVGEIAGVERSPVLQLPNSIGYFALSIGSVLVAIITLNVVLRVLRLGWDSRTNAESGEVAL
ncbi:TRAP transporter small permease subunit [Sinorhizobium sp. BJ1]|uniref:TRAP transporter small permease n=1 Tax=Sinorhizobium sp. BJ1 TaxID=2035455 RepID=UPI000BE86355|nr:TRAP transporter small permease subunit [Sinorhizobium sp. BJ1]PDT80554.1 C4-dicarboxylate ABC transporter permease [Sinorhizobium sp. BJ1]